MAARLLNRHVFRVDLAPTCLKRWGTNTQDIFGTPIYATNDRATGLPDFTRDQSHQTGHIARAAASEDHSRALRASTDRLPVEWRRPRGRPRQSWLRTIDSDLKPLNLGLHSALQQASDRPSWRRIVETAMLFERAIR